MWAEWPSSRYSVMPHHAGDVLGPEDGVEAPGQPVGVDVRAYGALGFAVLDDPLEVLVGGLCVSATASRMPTCGPAAMNSNHGYARSPRSALISWEWASLDLA